MNPDSSLKFYLDLLIISGRICQCTGCNNKSCGVFLEERKGKVQEDERSGWGRADKLPERVHVVQSN